MSKYSFTPITGGYVATILRHAFVGRWKVRSPFTLISISQKSFPKSFPI